MSPLGWFLLGFVVGVFAAIVVWTVKVGAMFAAEVKKTENEMLRRHGLYERGGRVRVGER